MAGTWRLWAVAGCCAMALAAPAAAPAKVRMPDSTAGSKRCGQAERFGYAFKVYVTRGKQRISCRRARRVVRKPPFEVRGWRYVDWTKGGNGPWSDVYERKDRRVVIGAIIQNA